MASAERQRREETDPQQAVPRGQFRLIEHGNRGSAGAKTDWSARKERSDPELPRAIGHGQAPTPTTIASCDWFSACRSVAQ